MTSTRYTELRDTFRTRCQDLNQEIGVLERYNNEHAQGLLVFNTTTQLPQYIYTGSGITGWVASCFSVAVCALSLLAHCMSTQFDSYNYWNAEQLAQNNLRDRVTNLTSSIKEVNRNLSSAETNVEAKFQFLDIFTRSPYSPLGIPTKVDVLLRDSTSQLLREAIEEVSQSTKTDLKTLTALKADATERLNASKLEALKRIDAFIRPGNILSSFTTLPPRVTEQYAIYLSDRQGGVRLHSALIPEMKSILPKEQQDKLNELVDIVLSRQYPDTILANLSTSSNIRSLQDIKHAFDTYTDSLTGVKEEMKSFGYCLQLEDTISQWINYFYGEGSFLYSLVRLHDQKLADHGFSKQNERDLIGFDWQLKRLSPSTTLGDP